MTVTVTVWVVVPLAVCSLDLNLVVVVTVCRAGGLEIRRVDEGQRTGTAVEIEQRLIRATRQAIGQRIAVGIGRGCGVDRARAFLSETSRASRAENRIVVRISDRDGDGLGGRPTIAVCSLADLNLVVVVTVCRAGGLEIRRVDEGQRTGTAVEVEQRLIRATRQAIGQRIAVGIGRGCGVDRARAFLSETGRASRAENRIVVRISDRDGDGLGGRPPCRPASISTS